MPLNRAKGVMLRRLGYLKAKLAQTGQRHVSEEIEALSLLLRCQGWLEPEQLEEVGRIVDACIARGLPAQARLSARAKRGDELVEKTSSLVERLQRALAGKEQAA